MINNSFSVTVNYDAMAEHSNLYRYLSAFRQHGHKYADVNPVKWKNGRNPEETKK